MGDSAAYLSYDEFDRVHIRIGRIVDVQDFPEARQAAYRLLIDFGPDIAIRKSSAQATKHYAKTSLRGCICGWFVGWPARSRSQIGSLRDARQPAWSAWLSSVSEPPCASAICRLRTRPMPEPPGGSLSLDNHADHAGCRAYLRLPM